MHVETGNAFQFSTKLCPRAIAHEYESGCYRLDYQTSLDFKDNLGSSPDNSEVDLLCWLLGPLKLNIVCLRRHCNLVDQDSCVTGKLHAPGSKAYNRYPLACSFKSRQPTRLRSSMLRRHHLPGISWLVFEDPNSRISEEYDTAWESASSAHVFDELGVGLRCCREVQSWPLTSSLYLPSLS